MAKIHELWYSISLKTRDKLVRAGKTFVQTLIATIPVGALIGADQAVVKAALVSAGAAAVSAAWNTIFPPSSGEVQLFPVYRDDILPPE
jgi:hypothetical protein